MATVMVGDVVAADGGKVETRATVQDDTDVHRLMCSRHKMNPMTGNKSVWCSHMIRLISSGGDAPQIDAITDPVAVTVPLQPTKDMWAPVMVEGMHHAGMHEVAMVVTGGSTVGELIHIGILAPHEGRNAMRLMLWDYLRYAYATVGPCTAGIHKESRFRDGWKKESTPSQQDIIDTYSVLTTGFCTACKPFTDFSDDIPEI